MAIVSASLTETSPVHATGVTRERFVKKVSYLSRHDLYLHLPGLMSNVTPDVKSLRHQLQSGNLVTCSCLPSVVAANMQTSEEVWIARVYTSSA